MTPIHIEYLNGFAADISALESGEVSLMVTALATGRVWQATRPLIEDAIALARRIASEQLASERWIRRSRRKRHG